MRYKLLSLMLLLVCLAWFAVSTTRAEVIISEIMYNPAGIDANPTASIPYTREWIELYNTYQRPVDISGWQIGNSLGYASPFPRGTVLKANQALVIAGDAVSFDAQWGTGINRIGVRNFPTYENSPIAAHELVALRDRAGNFQDRAYYHQTNKWPVVEASQGHSIFALPRGLGGGSNNVGSNWAPSAWGAYGAFYSKVNGQNHASPGFVETVAQAAFAPSPDAAWSMVVLPDTQNYVGSSADRHIFTRQTEWIRDNREEFKIQVVLHEGDIVNDYPSVQQWKSAQASMSVLNDHVPYIMAAGNHDYDNNNWPARTTSVNTYFKTTDNRLVDPARGGILKGMMTTGRIENAYYSFTAPDGRKMLIMALEHEPRPATVAWANEIAARPEFADHTAVLLTHAYLFSNNLRYTRPVVAASGEQTWQDFVKRHENIELVFSGHFGDDGVGYLDSIGDQGNTVHQMLLNTQHQANGGGGWLRVIEFLNDGTTARVRTYSPFYDMVRTHPDFQFEFEISPLTSVGRGQSVLTVPEPSGVIVLSIAVTVIVAHRRRIRRSRG